ncbi:MAG: 2,3,4,5-tetrahydropyridine-2,6-dicarboxylate N-succinyltransferase [Alphaproteobacteria bacterium]|nr:2,3,4,5-tetrahydropyridine-2,6-dicarboxylate N-succinyltransferase [Alphaproteobacteria bacterium]
MTDKLTQLEETINAAWSVRETIDTITGGEIREAVDETLNLLDRGTLRVASPSKNGWEVHQWVKKAVLLSFRLNPMQPITGGPGGSVWYDKVRNKFEGWGKSDFEKASFRVVPGVIARHSAYISQGAVLMPCFLNIGSRVGKGTMIDTWSTVGSCAQVGANCHISGGVGIGGVLEPLQAEPVIIEDNVFIGARSEVAEGVVVEKGSVISMGVFLGASTKIIDRKTGEIFHSRVPAYSVVIPGTLPSDKTLPDGSPAPSLACAVIVKRVDERTRSKTSVNELLRD